MKEFRLGSAPLVCAPGVIAWAINACAFDADREKMIAHMSEVWSGVPVEAMAQLLTKAVPYTVEGETVVFSARVEAASAS